MSKHELIGGSSEVNSVRTYCVRCNIYSVVFSKYFHENRSTNIGQSWIKRICNCDELAIESACSIITIAVIVLSACHWKVDSLCPVL